MKPQIRMTIASIVVICLALTAISGITYSWFSDSDTRKINVETAGMNLDVEIDEKSYYNSAKGYGTSVSFNNNETEIMISDLSANAYISIPYTITYESTIDVVARVTAKLINQSMTELQKQNITFKICDEAVTGTEITADGADLLPWTVKEKTTGQSVSIGNGNLVIETTKDFGQTGSTADLNFNIISEIYQKNYIITNLDAIATPQSNISMPVNKLVAINELGFTDSIAFSDVILDFSGIDADKFDISMGSATDGIKISITPKEESGTTVSGEVTMTFRYSASLLDLRIDDGGASTVFNSSMSEDDTSCYVVLKLPAGREVILIHENLE